VRIAIHFVKWHCDKSFSGYIFFSLSVSFHHCPFSSSSKKVSHQKVKRKKPSDNAILRSVSGKHWTEATTLFFIASNYNQRKTTFEANIMDLRRQSVNDVKITFLT
jgi:hypothetical protein